MKKFWAALLSAAIGGAASGVSVNGVGGSLKQSGIAAGMGALLSVVHLFIPPPGASTGSSSGSGPDKPTPNPTFQ